MSRSSPELVVVGCPSIDRLVVGGREVGAAGGAGFNTALAARLGGIDVGLVAAIPTHLRREVGAAFGPGGVRRQGLVVRDGVMPSFHIAYDAEQRADYLGVELGTELTMSGEDFPDDWLGAGHVHIGPLAASSQRQLEFARRIRERGFAGTLSAGSFLAELDEDRESALALVEMCALFFLNREEMDALYPSGPPAGLTTALCVTEGRRGATVYAADDAMEYPAEQVEVVDPTGAGDAFCGGYLAGWLRGMDPIAGAFAAARTALSGFGSTALVDAVAAMVGRRVSIDHERIDRVAGMLASEANAASLDFCGFPFPEAGEPWALECLALATLHEYGFWRGDAAGWVESMYAVAEGKRFKGSDYIWQAFTLAARSDPSILDPVRVAAEPMLFDEICRDDSGICPLPAVESHRELQAAYGAALLERGLAGFAPLLVAANRTDRPAATLLEILSSLPGYAEDPLAKKANLLLIILANRPEHFLDLRDPETITPIVDYHLMRSCLRTGCVRIDDAELRDRVQRRAWVDEAEEEVIRHACFEAINLLVEHSGLTQAAVDGFFFTNARKVCVELGEPDCSNCVAADACARETALFQPVFRTTAY